jgi:hypothetical protein
MSRTGKGFRWRVEESLVALGYARVLSWLISTYIPTLAEEVKHKFEDVTWPNFSVEQVGIDEELFGITYQAWFSEFSSLYMRQPPNHLATKHFLLASSNRTKYLVLANRIESLLQLVPTTMVHYLTPEVDVRCTKLRILVCDRDAITLSFDIAMTSCQAYLRFNQRLALFLSDLKDFIVPGHSLLSRYHALLATTLSVKSGGSLYSRRPHLALSGLLQHAKPSIDKRDAHMFCAYDRDKEEHSLRDFQMWNEWVFVEAIWKFASPNSKEAIWRALEDLLDLATQIDQVLNPEPSAPASTFLIDNFV